MRREEVFQKATRELISSGNLPRELEARVVGELARLQVDSGPRTKGERAHAAAFASLLKRAHAAPPVAPGGKRRLGDFVLEEREGEGRPLTAVADLSGRPVGHVARQAGLWIATTAAGEDLGFFSFKSTAVGALEEHEQALAARSAYKLSHQPDPEGAPGHAVESHYPDFYAHPEYYLGREREDRESLAALLAMRDNPEAPVTIYRALPDEAYGIEVGNWVTLSRTYAEKHAEQAEGPPWPVVTMRVRAKDVRTPGDSPHEWGYYPASEA